MLSSLILCCSFLVQAIPRTITIDERAASGMGIAIGDRVVLSGTPDGAAPETVLVSAITQRGLDPAEIARGDYRARLHLDQLQRLSGYGDRVDRFAIKTRPGADRSAFIGTVNSAAFGFRAYPSSEIAIETSRTFQVVSRFHKAIGVITIVASSIFLLCIMVLRVEERRRDVAALRLIGFSRISVIRSIVMEASVVALLGSMLGVGIGYLSSAFINWHYQAFYQTPLKFSVITTPVIELSVALSLLLGIAAGLIASTRLALARPLDLFGR